MTSLQLQHLHHQHLQCLLQFTATNSTIKSILSIIIIIILIQGSTDQTQSLPKKSNKRVISREENSITFGCEYSSCIYIYHNTKCMWIHWSKSIHHSHGQHSHIHGPTYNCTQRQIQRICRCVGSSFDQWDHFVDMPRLNTVRRTNSIQYSEYIEEIPSSLTSSQPNHRVFQIKVYCTSGGNEVFKDQYGYYWTISTTVFIISQNEKIFKDQIKETDTYQAWWMNKTIQEFVDKVTKEYNTEKRLSTLSDDYQIKQVQKNQVDSNPQLAEKPDKKSAKSL